MVNLNEFLEEAISQGRISQEGAKQIMRDAGFTGEFGGGRAEAFFTSNPQASAAGFERLGSLSPAGAYQNQGYQRYTSSTPVGQGVMPLGVEPLHQFERQALEAIGSDPYAEAGRGISPYASTALSRVSPVLEQALSEYVKAGELSRQPFNPDELEQYINPFRQQVIDRTIAGLSEQAKELRDQVTRQQATRGAASFGGLRHSQRLGDIDEELLSKGADVTAGLNYQAYDDAIRNLFNQRNQAIQGTLSTGSGITGVATGFGNLATQAQDVASAGQNLAYRARGAQQQAGQTIRGFNQALSDIALQDYLGQQNFPLERLQTTLGILPSFQSNTQQQYQAVPSSGQRLGAGLSAAGQFIGSPTGQNLIGYATGGAAAPFNPNATYYNAGPLPWLNT